jgi:hypothetical protein
MQNGSNAKRLKAIGDCARNEPVGRKHAKEGFYYDVFELLAGLMALST